MTDILEAYFYVVEAKKKVLEGIEEIEDAVYSLSKHYTFAVRDIHGMHDNVIEAFGSVGKAYRVLNDALDSLYYAEDKLLADIAVLLKEIREYIEKKGVKVEEIGITDMLGDIRLFPRVVVVVSGIDDEERGRLGDEVRKKFGISFPFLSVIAGEHKYKLITPESIESRLKPRKK